MGAFGKFEGSDVNAATLNFRGTSVADQTYHKGDEATFIVRAQCAAVNFRDLDDVTTRGHAFRVIDVAIAVEPGLVDAAGKALQAAQAGRLGATPLEFPDGPPAPEWGPGSADGISDSSDTTPSQTASKPATKTPKPPRKAPAKPKGGLAAVPDPDGD